MRRILPLLLVTGLLAVFGAPSVSACSVAYEPFKDPTWNEFLHYIDGGYLHRVQNGVDSEVAEGWFLSYAARGNVRVVAGQEGLGAGCEGDAWLRIQQGGQVAVERDGSFKVFDMEAGAVVQDTNSGEVSLYDWETLEEQVLEPVPRNSWLLGWSAGMHPVYTSGSELVAGGRVIEIPEGVNPFDAAPGNGGVGIVFNSEDQMMLMFVPDDKQRPVTSVTWEVPLYGQGTAVWHDAWYIAGHERAYRVDDTVMELGVTAAHSVGSAANGAIVFHGDKYTIFDGTSAVTSAQKVEGFWVPTAVQTVPQEIPSEQTEVDSIIGKPSTSQESVGPASMLMVVGIVGLVAVFRRPQRL